MTLLDPLRLREQFPSLARRKDGRPVIFADGPGGTQVPRSVTAAMTTYLETSNANFGGTFVTSKETGDLVAQVRAGVKNLFNAAVPEEIIFGQNMTSLTFAMSRAIARTWQAGDEIIVTALDHDANVAPWMLAAEDRGAIVRTLPFHSHDATLSLEKFTSLLSSRTRMVALGYASNAVGTIIDLAPFISAAHRVGALVYVDAVHFAPHGIIDVRAIDCDFLACSAYKFCGPHIGILYGKHALLESLTAYKVRTSSAVPPGKWETGTQNTEALAGLRACLAYLGDLGSESSPDHLSRLALTAGMKRIVTHEAALSRRFLAGLSEVSGARLYGISDPARILERTPTFGFTLNGCLPRTAAERLAERGIFVWDGHFYAKGVIDQLGLAQHGGLIRIGFVHYNTIDEVDQIVAAVKKLAI